MRNGRRRSTLAACFAGTLLLAVGCSGGGGHGQEDVTPPAGLAYSTNPASYPVGQAIAPNTPSSTGGAVASYAVAPDLPAGLALDPATGVLSGTPTAASATTTYVVTATNAGGHATVDLVITVRAPQVLFSDDFESYALGGFPTAGSWALYYSGAGASQQYVDATHAVSGTKALHLAGANSCWSATVLHALEYPQVYSYELNVYVDQIVSCGCSSFLAEMGPGPGYHVAFYCDGYIYARLQYDPNQVQRLMAYQAGTWYHVKVDVDQATRRFDVSVNGTRVGEGLQSLDTTPSSSFLMAAEHGAGPVVWYDDVKVTAP